MGDRIDSYKLIREQIINDIERGVYQPGDTIPKQMEFAGRYNVSRGTVRKALDDLIKRGVLVTTKGKGTIVAPFDTGAKDVYRPLSFSKSKRVDSNKLRSKVIEIRKITAEPWLAKQLKISIGAPVIYLRRVRILDGRPENYQCSYFSCERIEGVELESLDLEHGSLFEYISRETGLYAVMKSEEIRAVFCPDFVAEELQMHANDPVLLIMRTVFGQDDMPLEYCEDYECTNVKGLLIVTRGSVDYEKISEGMDENSQETETDYQ